MPTDFRARIDPELLGVLRRMPRWDWTPLRVRLARLALRLIPELRAPAGVSREVLEHQGQQLRVFQPSAGSARAGALLWLHGGGRILGEPRMDDPTCTRLARELGVVVVAPSYRLAPEHPFPAGLDDVHRAWHWLVDRHGDGPLLVAGASAGGGLAAELCQRLRDEGGPLPRAQLLVYPMLDDRTATRDDLTEAGYLVWSNASNHHAWSCYLSREPGAAELPDYASAARCVDLSGLPPAWLVVGGLDLFWDEVHAYAEGLEAAGGSAALLEIPGAFHGFFLPEGREAPIQSVWDSLLAFARAHLG